MTSRPSAGQDLEPSSAPPRKLPDEREEGKSGGALRSGCLSTPCLLTALSVLLTHSHAVFYVPLAGGGLGSPSDFSAQVGEAPVLGVTFPTSGAAGRPRSTHVAVTTSRVTAHL